MAKQYAMNSSKRVHFCQSIEGALQNWTPDDWEDACKWIKRCDGIAFESGAEIKQLFIKLLSEGWLVIPFDGCDNFSKKDGCKGHDVEAKS